MSRNVHVRIVAQTDEYIRKMRSVGKFTEKELAREAKKHSAHLRKVHRAAELAAIKGAKNAASNWDVAFKTVATAIGAYLINGFGQAALQIGQEVADLRNELGDLSAATGISTEALSGLRLAAKQNGKELQNLLAGVRGFPKRLGDMALGTGEAKIAFEELGITSEDAAAMLDDTDGAFRQIVRSLQAVESDGKRAEMATRIFGEAGLDLMQVLGDRSLEEFTATAARFGADVGPKAIESAQKWQRSSALLQTALDGAKGAIFDTVAESKAFNNAVQNSIKTTVFWANLVTNLATTFDRWDLVNPIGRIKEVVEGMRRARIQTMLYMQSLNDAVAANQEFGGSGRDGFDELAEGAAGADDRAKEVGQRLDKLMKISNDAALALKTDAEKMEIAYLDVQLQIDELAAGYPELANAAAQAQENLTKKHAAETAERRQTEIDEAAAAFQDLADMTDDVLGAFDQVADEIHEKRMNQIKEWTEATFLALNLIGDIAGFFADQQAEQAQARLDDQKKEIEELREAREQAADAHEATLDALAERQRNIDQMDSASARRAAQERLDADKAAAEQADEIRQKAFEADLEREKTALREAKKAVRQAARAQKQAAIMGVLVNTSEAILKGFALGGPPPSPVGIMMAATAAATGAFELAAIHSQPLPSAHSGAFISPDEMPMMLRANEAVLNQRAAADIGGRAAIEALNRGEGMAPIVVQSVVDGRVVSEVVARQLATRRGPLHNLIAAGRAPAGQISPYAGG